MRRERAHARAAAKATGDHAPESSDDEVDEVVAADRPSEDLSAETVGSDAGDNEDEGIPHLVRPSTTE
jgi:hypothetical protein